MKLFTEYQLEQAYEMVNPSHNTTQINRVFDDPGEDNLDCAVASVIAFTGLHVDVRRLKNGKVHFSAH